MTAVALVVWLYPFFKIPYLNLDLIVHLVLLLAVGEKGQGQQAGTRDRAGHRKQPRRTGFPPACTHAREQQHEQGRRHQQHLDRRPGRAIGVEAPGIALEQVEA